MWLTRHITTHHACLLVIWEYIHRCFFFSLFCRLFPRALFIRFDYTCICGIVPLCILYHAVTAIIIWFFISLQMYHVFLTIFLLQLMPAARHRMSPIQEQKRQKTKWKKMEIVYCTALLNEKNECVAVFVHTKDTALNLILCINM